MIRKEGPTPNGGAYSEAYFYSEDFKPSPKSKATRAETTSLTEGQNHLPGHVILSAAKDLLQHTLLGEVLRFAQ